MQIDLTIDGWAVVIGMSVVFGVVAQLIVGWGRQRWAWLIGAVAYFVGAFLTSEWMFATATEATNQPNIGGLSFDEALFGGLVVGLVAVAVTWLASRQTRIHGPIGT